MYKRKTLILRIFFKYLQNGKRKGLLKAIFWFSGREYILPHSQFSSTSLRFAEIREKPLLKLQCTDFEALLNYLNRHISYAWKRRKTKLDRQIIFNEGYNCVKTPLLYCIWLADKWENAHFIESTISPQCVKIGSWLFNQRKEHLIADNFRIYSFLLAWSVLKIFTPKVYSAKKHEVQVFPSSWQSYDCRSCFWHPDLYTFSVTMETE